MRYFGWGERRYGQRPIKIMRRMSWEIEVVLAGRIAPTFGKNAPIATQPLSSSSLWIFAPHLEHGWTGSLMKTNKRLGSRSFILTVSVPALQKQFNLGVGSASHWMTWLLADSLTWVNAPSLNTTSQAVGSIYSAKQFSLSYVG